MRQLDVIDKKNRLNNVYALDSVNHGAYNSYYVESAEIVNQSTFCVRIDFQNGAREDINSIAGVTDEDLLEIVRDRLSYFQTGELACYENQEALDSVEEALYWLKSRKADRKERGVLGKYEA
jgi:hypothetical protein